VKFFGKDKHKQTQQTILFVCVENAGRSQMAEGFFNKYAPRDTSVSVLEQNQYHKSILLPLK